MKTIIIGDIHGCAIELEQLLKTLSLSSDDTVYSVGDILDKGPYILESIDLCIEYNVKNICGNHDDKYRRWLKHEQTRIDTGKKNPMTSVSEKNINIYNKMTKEQSEYLTNAPLTIFLDEHNTMLIHGGLFPINTMPIEKQLKKRKSEIMRLRFLDRDTMKFVPLIGSLEQPPNTILWSEVWDGPFNVVYGHISHSRSNPRIDKKENNIECVGIDTGCVIGGHLTAYILETKEFVQVKSKDLYCSENPEEM